MAHPPDDAVSQQAGQGSVDGRVRLAQDARQLRRVDEWHPAEGVKHLSVRDAGILEVPVPICASIRAIALVSSYPTIPL